MLDITELHLKPRFITDENGEKAVVLSEQAFADLLENYEDLLLLAQSVKDQEPFMSHEDFTKELKAEGLL